MTTTPPGFAPADVETTPANPEWSSESAPRALRIAVVEDDREFARLIADVLARSWAKGADIRLVPNGHSALALLFGAEGEEGRRPDLLLLDLGLPCLDGRELLAEVTVCPELEGMPVVVLTSSVAEADRQFCRGLGVARYLNKPRRLSELEDALGGLAELVRPG